MVLDRQKVGTDGRTDGMDGRTDGHTDDAKTISLRLRRGINSRTSCKWAITPEGILDKTS